jgi:hypothetical protein
MRNDAQLTTWACMLGVATDVHAKHAGLMQSQKLVDNPAYNVRRGPYCGAPTPTPEPSRSK